MQSAGILVLLSRIEAGNAKQQGHHLFDNDAMTYAPCSIECPSDDISATIVSGKNKRFIHLSAIFLASAAFGGSLSSIVSVFLSFQ